MTSNEPVYLASKPVGFENIHDDEVDGSSSSETSNDSSSSGLVTSSHDGSEETSGLRFNHHAPKQQFSCSTSACSSSSDDSSDYENHNSVSSKIKSTVRCGITEDLGMVSKVAQVTSVSQVAGKVLR